MRFANARILVRLLLAFQLAGAGVTLFGQARFQSQASGTWSSSGTWMLTAGTDADGVPDANDSVFVTGGNVVTVAGADVECAVLTVDAGAALGLTGAGNVRVNAAPGIASINGTVTLESSGTLQKQGTGTRTLLVGNGGKIIISGTAATPVFDSYALDPGSTFEYSAAGNQNILSGIVYDNLTLGGSGKKTVTPIPVDTVFRMKGTLSVATGVTFDVSTNILRIYFDGDVINYGTIDASVGTTALWMNGAQWLNYGTYLASTTPGYGIIPTTTFNNTAIGGGPQTFYDLVVQGTITALSNFTVGRHLTISPGAIFNAGTALTHTVGGNWTNNGTFNYATSTIVFNGDISRTISASTFYQVVVNDTAGVLLTGNMTIAPGGSLTLSGGDVATGAASLIINAADPAALVLGSHAIAGTVTRALAPGSTGTYLFFDANAFVIPGGIGNPSAITAVVHPATNPPDLLSAADTALVVKRYYTITGSGMGPGFSYTLRLPYAQSEVRGREYLYTLWKNGGTGWSVVGTSGPVDTAANYAEQTGLTGFSDWTLAENTAPLPIQLGSFQASVNPAANNVTLTWTTISEINNYGFYVQRSAGSGFVDLPDNFVHGSGTTLTPKQYQWIDRSMPSGTYSYRLNQVDLDGSSHPTDAVKVTVGTATAVENGRTPMTFSLSQNYPNPFNPSTRITFSVEKVGTTTLKVYNILGEEVALLFTGGAEPGREYSVSFDGSALANGAYFYSLTSGEKTSLKRMILLK